MAPILVTGGTGTLGKHVVRQLLDQGRDVRVLTRRDRLDTGHAHHSWAVGDLRTGVGLTNALVDVTTVVHCATSGSSADVTATRRLCDAAKRSGVPTLVYISIVGVDQIAFSYYRAKLAAEHVIATAGLPWTILRATQFHDLLIRVFSAQRRLPAIFVPADTDIQPIDTAEVATRLVELASQPAAGRVSDMGGPEVRGARDFAEVWVRAEGLRRKVVGVTLPGATFAAFRRGGHLTPQRTVGKITFEQYLARKQL